LKEIFHGRKVKQEFTAAKAWLFTFESMAIHEAGHAVKNEHGFGLAFCNKTNLSFWVASGKNAGK